MTRAVVRTPLTGPCLRYHRPSACQRDWTSASQLNLLCKPRRSGRSGVVSSNGGDIHDLSHTDEGCSHSADRRAHRCRVRKYRRGAGMNLIDTGPEGAAANIFDTTPENQAATFRNQDQVWPVRVIRRGDAVRPLPPHARSLAELTFEVGEVRLGLSDHMARGRTAGLLILKRGEIALECYGMGNGPESRWTSMSTAK